MLARNQFASYSRKYGDLQEKILKKLDEPKSRKKLAKELGVPYATLFYHLTTLLRDGKIEINPEMSGVHGNSKQYQKVS